MTLTAAAATEASGAASDKERRLLAVSQKQDRLLYLCAYLLLNLSEDPDIERKMQKKVSFPCVDSGWRSWSSFLYLILVCLLSKLALLVSLVLEHLRGETRNSQR